MISYGILQMRYPRFKSPSPNYQIIKNKKKIVRMGVATIKGLIDFVKVLRAYLNFVNFNLFNLM